MPDSPTVPITLEYSLGELKDRSAARRQRVLLEAAPQIREHYQKLKKMSQRGIEHLDNELSTEALDFYNRVVTDGRYVKLLRTDPRAAAEKLGIQIDERVASAISQISSRLGGDVQGPIEAVIAVAVVIACAAQNPAEGIVIDDVAAVRARL